jgi:hypothetical protein
MIRMLIAELWDIQWLGGEKETIHQRNYSTQTRKEVHNK